MALLCSLAVVMCELLPLLESKRVNRGIAHEVQSSGHSEDADMSAVAYGEKLLACELTKEGNKIRIIIQDKDKPFVDYLHAVDDILREDPELEFHEPSPINCKTFTLPPKPSSILRNLTTHTLPEDVIGLIGSFNHDVHCWRCNRLSFNMTLLEKCSTALTRNQGARAHKEVEEECMAEIAGAIKKSRAHKEYKDQTLQACMASPKANQVATCHLPSGSRYKEETKRRIEIIKKSEGAIQARQELIKKTNEEHQKFIKKSQELIKKEREKIKDVQDYLDMGEQNTVYLTQIFEGP